ncbi:hypothetical protein AN958_00109 [Leucoagaricus sp. SymC.cos]|nr:hypothetical protein AN958_00109 [Leucoagaricus sp. SymC.cos]
MSPRFREARSLRARNYLYIDGRYPEPFGPNKSLNRRKRFADDNSSPTPARGPSGGPLFVEAFQVVMDEFDGRKGSTQREGIDVDVSRSPSPDVEDYADAKEELDEADREYATANVVIKDDTDLVVEEGEYYSEENSLSNRSQASEISKPTTLGGIMVELWMWLQFAIIMLVFLWAMARKGPKSVLKDAERKRTLSMKKIA